MKIIFDSIKDPGVLDKERVIFKVIESVNIGHYIAAESVSITNETFSSKIQNIFWFPDQEMKEGDLVVLYSKKGTKADTINADSSTTYFYYWGLTRPHTDVEKAIIVLLETSWKIYEVPNVKDEKEIPSQE